MNPTAAHTPAKINLGLEILRTRADGFHDINSVFLPIPLFDEIIFAPTNGEIICACETLPADGTNLCVRAATALQQHFGKADRGVAITLKKNIPVGAGLGGGSSDAACTLNALNELWELNASHDSLHVIAKSLGADVPFFLSPQPAVVRGIGDEITPVIFPLTFSLLLVMPPIHINTAWAYSLSAAGGGVSAESDYENIVAGLRSIEELGKFFRNDFERFIFPQHPVLEEIKSRLIFRGAAFASMSGSGSTIYGIFETREAALQAAKTLGEFAVRVMDIAYT